MSAGLPAINLKSGTDHYAVIGNPISHSLSPLIHKLFAEQTNQNLKYQAIEAPVDKFTETVEQFRRAGGRGLNVTVPFKQQAWKLVNRRSGFAERAGAVNTLWFDDQDLIRGYNTDGKGLVRDITINHGRAIRDKRILILGAGGAVRGVLEPLLNEEPAGITIANRTLSRAVELVDRFSDLGEIAAVEYTGLARSRYDLIINGTSASLHGELPPIADNLLTKEGGCYDMMYSKQPTAFVKWGLDQGTEFSVDGLGMLIEQAAESFYIWRHVRPETKPVIARLRN